jgi:hypothetical protein
MKVLKDSLGAVCASIIDINNLKGFVCAFQGPINPLLEFRERSFLVQKRDQH